ncbi:putative kinetochore protein SPC25 [Dioszegia hungarica]|uniref:Kinetochore protein SPC25 n=1 Tax=Dioszegia hungarica TaxID=4972 RepID=A0AA38LWD6_9TREE|nr:putative kinetochore protein SPC25 [Dioszegia hungarica]KAI9637528.1 putative kinetochore protein SPC25 [Dioszegia hungarica]
MSASQIQPVSLLDIVHNGSLDLQWDPFHSHVDAFLRAIDKYAQEARIEIASRATEHSEQVREFKAGKEEMERRINNEREKEAQMLASLESERHAHTDLQAAVSHLQTTLQKVREETAALEVELRSVKREVAGERAEKERQRATLDDQKAQDQREVEVLEDILGLNIVGGDQPNTLLFKFRLVDPLEPEREFALVADVSQYDYKVTRCDPPIPNLGVLVQQLNEDRNIMAFIKRARKAFRQLVPEPPKPPSRFDDLSGPGAKPSASQKKGAEDVLDGAGVSELRLE